MNTQRLDLPTKMTHLLPDLDQLKSLAQATDVSSLDPSSRRTFVLRLREVANCIDPDRDPKERGKDELREASDHLGYEMDMFFSLATLLAWGEKSGELRFGSPRANAILEAFLVHARILDEFLYAEQRRVPQDTMLAQHYCAEWENRRPDPPGDFLDAASLRGLEEQKKSGCSGPERLRDHINREIVHLGHSRKDVTQRGWRVMRIAHLMWGVTRRFCELAGEEADGTLSDKFWQRVRSHL
jgi:hypothetical protein